MISVFTINRDNVGSYLDSILAIEKASFISPWSSNSFVQEVRNPVSYFYGILEDGSLAGYICFWMFDCEIQLLNIAVHPDKRGKGFGRRLLQEMIATGNSRGMDQIWLEVRTSNLTAKRLYEEMGFAAVGRRPRYYRDTNEDAIVMSLNISGRQPCRKASN